MAIAPDRVHGEWRQDLWGVSGEAATRLPDPGTLYRWRITPVGEGLTGRGWNIPLPCLLHLRLNGVHRPPPPPGAFRGGGQLIGDCTG